MQECTFVEVFGRNAARMRWLWKHRRVRQGKSVGKAPFPTRLLCYACSRSAQVTDLKKQKLDELSTPHKDP